MNTAATVVLFEAPENELHRFGIAKIKKVNGFDLIENFIEKPTIQQAPSKFANAGYYVMVTYVDQKNISISTLEFFLL